MTPNDHMSHDLSYFSGPRTSGAVNRNEGMRKMMHLSTKNPITHIMLLADVSENTINTKEKQELEL